jgi:hypothetical protein
MPFGNGCNKHKGRHEIPIGAPLFCIVFYWRLVLDCIVYIQYTLSANRV